MSDRLADIQARADAATPGPWEHVDFGEGGEFMGCGSVITMNEGLLGGDIAVPSGDCYPRSGYNPLADMAFIAAAREDIPWLLDQVCALTEERDQARAEVARGRDQIRHFSARDAEAQARIDAAKALHRQVPQFQSQPVCSNCVTVAGEPAWWPCATADALDGTPEPQEEKP